MGFSRSPMALSNYGKYNSYLFLKNEGRTYLYIERVRVMDIDYNSIDRQEIRSRKLKERASSV